MISLIFGEFRLISEGVGSVSRRLSVFERGAKIQSDFCPTIATIELEQTEARPVGTVTIDNEKYGRYMGEIQVTLVDLPKDEKVNTITRIIEKDQTILPLIKAGNQFTLVTEGTIENEFRKLNN